MLTKLIQTFHHLSLKPFDTSTEEGRSKERFRRIALTSISSVVLKFLTISSALISVPLTLHYLGSEQYGMWLTISSFIALLGFADLGMGNGLVNLIAAAYGTDDYEAGRRAITAAFVMLSSIAAGLFLIFILAFPFVNWAGFFNVHSPEARQEAGTAMLILFTGLVLNMPTGVVIRVQTGYQEGYQSNLWGCAGSLFALSGLLVAIHFKAHLPTLVFVFEVLPIVIKVLNGLYYFGIEKPQLRPRLSSFSPEIAHKLLGTGLLFLVLGITSSLSYTSDNLVIAHVIGTKHVAQYAISARPFAVISAVTMMVVAPMWPAYGEALARGDFAWIKRVLTKSVQMTLVTTTIPAAMLVLLAKPVYHMWVGSRVPVSFPLLVGLAAWCVIGTIGNCFAMYLNGTHVIKFQVWVAVPCSIVTLIAKIFLGKHFGLQGVIYATTVVYILMTIIPYLIYTSIAFKKAKTLTDETTVVSPEEEPSNVQLGELSI